MTTNKYSVAFILFALCLTLGQTGPTKSCRTLNGEIGELIDILRCPEYFLTNEIFHEGNNDLISSVCENNKGFLVCCPKITNFENEEGCGLPPVGDDLLKKGIVSVPEFPWVVGIIVHNVEIPAVVCSGSLINARYVLSSTKCLIYPDSKPEFSVRIQGFYSNDNTKCSFTSSLGQCNATQEYVVRELIIHKLYDPVTELNNIALLRLDGLVPFDGYHRPVCLPTSEFQLVQPDDTLSLVSWNKTVQNEVFFQKPWSVQKTILSTVISNKACKKVLNVSESAHMCDMCTTILDNAGACNDIVGNPVMFHDGKRWHLEGISHSCGNDTRLLRYTKIQNYMPWIQANIKNEQCTTPNGQTGECMYLADCPKLLNAFANPRKGSAGYLSRFICEKERRNFVTAYSPIVCCGTSENFAVFESTSFEAAAINTNALSEAVATSKTCGIQNEDDPNSENENIAVNEFPWTAGIYTSNDDDSSATHLLATGALITHRYILTAARYIVSLEANELFVLFGTNQIINRDDCSTKQGLEHCGNYTVKEKLLHPLFFISKGLCDIALLRLKQKVEYSDFIRPICLPIPEMGLIKPGDTLYLTRWLNTKEKNLTSLLSNDDCRKQLAFTHLTPSSNQFCTEKFANISNSTCRGVTGSPLMLPHEHQWFLVGIPSVVTCVRPPIYNKVSEYLEWIYDNMKP